MDAWALNNNFSESSSSSTFGCDDSIKSDSAGAAVVMESFRIFTRAARAHWACRSRRWGISSAGWSKAWGFDAKTCSRQSRSSPSNCRAVSSLTSWRSWAWAWKFAAVWRNLAQASGSWRRPSLECIATALASLGAAGLLASPRRRAAFSFSNSSISASRLANTDFSCFSTTWTSWAIKSTCRNTSTAFSPTSGWCRYFPLSSAPISLLSAHSTKDPTPFSREPTA
mmetsp:Transcript_58178/g.127558  ORF Transcript_58178/g.127558 Transcript_58178/m.127558 type:complete len:226 (-) Transcript_58178:186-863(-)